MKPDKRMTPRMPICRSAQVKLSGGRAIIVKTADLAMGGVSIISSESLPIGTTCLIIFDLPLNGLYHKVAMVAQVLYAAFHGLEGSKIGLKFLEIDEKSAATLSKFMNIPINKPKMETESGNDAVHEPNKPN